MRVNIGSHQTQLFGELEMDEARRRMAGDPRGTPEIVSLILDLYDQEGEDEDCAIAVLHARGSKLEFEAGAALCGERRRTSVSSEPTSCPN